MKKLITIVLVVLCFACHPKEVEQDSSFLSRSGDTIIVPTHSPLWEKIHTTKIQSSLFSSDISTYGVIRSIPNNYAEIASPFAGRITKSHIRLGQKVDVDDPIFEISSPSFFEASKVYYQAKQEMQLAKKNLNRQRDLYGNGVGVQKDLEEAEVSYELLKRDYENAIASLRVYKVDPDHLVLGQALTVRSPIAGEVIKNNIVIGQYLKEDAEAIAAVAELSKIWVVAQIKEKDISFFHEFEDIEVTLTAVSDMVFKGKIYHISEILDEETRSVQAYVECDNTERLLKPGMYASVKFIDKAGSRIVIPASSVFQHDKESFVFVLKGPGKFVKKNVEVAGLDNDQVVLISGLIDGDTIVTAGGYYMLDFN